ncbi:MAG: hypothetical protein DRG83_13285 [Deltaproteobacteria bacterium]|nr:MAG: hypothetical protein DRG83_13285 [Deltaproteobacteria bacterium]
MNLQRMFSLEELTEETTPKSIEQIAEKRFKNHRRSNLEYYKGDTLLWYAVINEDKFSLDVIYKKIENTFRVSLLRRGDNPEAYAGLGHLMLNLGEYQKAISYYTESIEFEPDQEEAYLGLAIAYYISGNINAAKGNYQKIEKTQVEIPIKSELEEIVRNMESVFREESTEHPPQMHLAKKLSFLKEYGCELTQLVKNEEFNPSSPLYHEGRLILSTTYAS